MKLHLCRLIAWVIFLLLVPLIAYAQQSPVPKHSSLLRFEHVFEAFPDGISPHSNLPHIIQDSAGMMWFAGDSLYRYDGTQLYPYQLDPMSICSSFITGMAIDLDGILWITTEKGVCQYVANTDKFKPFGLHTGQALSRNASAINVSPNNEVYIGFSSELAIINPARTDITFLSSPLKSQYHNRSNEFRAIFFESANSVWLGSLASGLIHFSPSTGFFEHYMNTPAQPNLLPSNDVRTIAMDKQGDLWFGMHQGGVSKLLKDKKTFQHYLNDDDSYNLGSSYIWSIKLDSTGQLWLASDGGGLLGYNADSDSFFAYRHDVNNRNSIASNKPTTVYEDSANNLWVSLYPEGIDLINRSSADVNQFYANSSSTHSVNDNGILSIFEDSQQSIWIGTEKGLNRFNKTAYTFENYSDGSQAWAIPQVPITYIAEDHKGQLWFSTWGEGLYRVSPQNQQVTHFAPSKTNPNTVDAARFWGILPESEHILFASEGVQGILQFRFDTQSFSRIHLVDGGSAFNGTHVYNVLRDSKDNLWIASIGGLYRQAPAGELVELSSESFNPSTISSFRIRSLFEDNRNNIWVGTEDQGVYIYNPQSQHFKHLGLAQGIPSNNITKIQQSPDGDIWLFTRNGLARINQTNQAVKVFNKAHGLADSNFNRGAGFIDSDGTLYAGAAKGLSILNVQSLKSKIQHFPVHITGLKLFNKTIKAGEYPLENKSILQAKAITLRHTDDVFTLNFAGLSYPLSRWNQYAYRLEGYDATWNYIGKNHSATYTNIPAGKYTFHVKAQDQHGNWSDQQDSLAITINPAPWQTWWAYVGYILLAILILQALLYLHAQRLKYRKEKLLNAEIIRLNAVREALRRDFMADISHELRTPLSILTGEVEAVQDGIRPLSMATVESIRSEVTMIKKIVNDLYDLALSDSGAMQCNMKKVDISQVLTLAVSQMQIKFEQKSIELKLNIAAKGLFVEGDQQRLHQLFLNLLENSFRYTFSEGTLAISAYKKNAQVIVDFSDTAPAVEKYALNDIFKRFYTVDTSRNREHGGSGLGLSICKNIALAHGANISAHPSPLGGLRIKVEFPYFGSSSI
ncbi:ligand-binding sensor domain-containing protein [Marinagarivorans cellulosilyticus]|uniref:histidine kinase n=1 Tax=Marinagarivorans cellulosilyticus TaxID=2721545 RepID=A0AAN1WJG8_9GAMM|nr:two-component regulator propeller domain-containing protein [Marinagarivorans cellulosilyticus]BCD98741.1 hypothetical protein MARGE09_P2942 [Marinagarivorans cellulosilyticus]